MAEAISDEMAALYNTANKSLRIRFAHKKRKESLTISDIAQLLHSSPTTIRKYFAIPEEEIPEDKKERSRMREQEEQDKPQSEFIQRKSLCQLIYKKLENIAIITAGQYKQALETYPLLNTLYSLVKEFHAAIFSKKPEKVDTWIESAKKHDISELQSFVEGILKDSTDIKNGIIFPYNNGLAEGSVNKIKVIKRIMYGRNRFELLKAKVLFHELFHVEFN